ncbi:MAG: hypothetical protein IRY93_12635 [Chthoniobacterales bacterium]|nr:hypothetical protein [Chthoniobacterales bacterium]
MKGLLRVFELAKNEQRVVLAVMLLLVALAFLGYERRTDRSALRATSRAQAQTSPTPHRAGQAR